MNQTAPSAALDVLHHQHAEGRVWPLWHSGMLIITLSHDRLTARNLLIVYSNGRAPVYVNVFDMMEEKCAGCTCELKRGVAHRRKLYSESTRHVLPVLSGLLGEEYLSEDVDKLLPPVDSALSKEEIFVCMKCFRHLEKLIRLEKEKIQVEESLKSGFLKVKQFIELRAKGQQDEPPTPSRSRRKRSRLSSSSPAGPLKKASCT